MSAFSFKQNKQKQTRKIGESSELFEFDRSWCGLSLSISDVIQSFGEYHRIKSAMTQHGFAARNADISEEEKKKKNV